MQKKNKNLEYNIPHKIAYSFLGIFLLGIILYGVFYYFRKEKEMRKDDKNSLITVSTPKDIKKSDDLFLDSDGDGAYDWEEELWPELDPQNPDSDGDGVLDGEYIKQKRRNKEKERREILGINDNISEADKLGRGVYTALLMIKKEGGKIDSEAEDKISENIVNYIENIPLNKKVYLRDDLHKVENSKENSFLYKKKIKLLFEKYPVDTSEIMLIIEGINNQEKNLSMVETAAIKYNNYLNELTSMDVPSLIAGRHTELINIVSQLYGALSNLSNREYDDIVALSSVVQIKKILESLVDTNYHIGLYLDLLEKEGIFDN